MLEARAAVRKLKQYQPPLGNRSGLRLDFNENTGGCSPRVIERLRQLQPEQLACYPEREPVERTVASFLGLQPEQVLLTNGVDEAIHLVCEAYLEPEGHLVSVAGLYGGTHELIAGVLPKFGVRHSFVDAPTAQAIARAIDCNLL